MFDDLMLTGRELLIAVILASLFYLLGVLSIFRRGPHGSDSTLRERLSAMETELAAIRTRLEYLEAQPPAASSLDTQAMSLADAMRLAREGVPPGDIAERLGISRGEAELITALHKSGT